ERRARADVQPRRRRLLLPVEGRQPGDHARSRTRLGTDGRGLQGHGAVLFGLPLTFSSQLPELQLLCGAVGYVRRVRGERDGERSAGAAVRRLWLRRRGCRRARDLSDVSGDGLGARAVAAVRASPRARPRRRAATRRDRADDRRHAVGARGGRDRPPSGLARYRRLTTSWRDSSPMLPARSIARTVQRPGARATGTVSVGAE